MIRLRGIFLTSHDVVAAAQGNDVPVCITPRSGRPFFALAADPSIILPLVDSETGAQYSRVYLEACR